MKRMMVLAAMALSLASVLSSSADVVRSHCTRTIAAGVDRYCTLLPVGPVYRAHGSAAPDATGVAQVHVVITDQQRLAVIGECTGEATGTAASCDILVFGEASGNTPSAVNQFDGNALPIRCYGTGTGPGQVSCEASTV